MAEPSCFEGADGNRVALRLAMPTDDLSYDLLVDAVVEVRGFRGVVDAWVTLDGWRAFEAELLSLEAKRRGEAQLCSMVPGELELTIHSTDPAGHMGIRGELKLESHAGTVELRFSTFAFDPTSLPEVVRVARSWTSR